METTIENELCSDSDVDSEGVLEEMEQIDAVLVADENSQSMPFSQMTSVASSSALATLTPISCTSKKELTKVEEALELNRLMDAKYQKLENLLTLRLQECQAKLKEIGSFGVSRDLEVNNFRYYQCGRPYFKDKFNFPAPPNEDTIVMQRSQMYDFSTLVTAPGWTVNDKTMFTNVMLKLSQEMKVKELLAKIAVLKRDTSKHGQDNEDKIRKLNKQIIDVKTKPLIEVALPIDKEYDWEALANKLSNRHLTQEYRSFWRLFFHPSINKKPWNKVEHKKLQEIASENNYEDWDKIAKLLNTKRTGYQCFVYFRTNVATTHNGKKWTPEEVEYLKRLIDFYKEDNYIPWTRVASSMVNRTKIQVYNKYIRMKVGRKGRFLPEEDAVIWNCYKKFGEDYKKINEFLPGRSICQIRMRLSILMQKNLSVIWSVEEDRKLLQLMSNEDSSTFYSNATKHFPGKSRAHIRSRYMTLVNWMRRNPHWDVEYAPRRGARRLTHGYPNDDLNEAVENLEQRIKDDVNIKKSGKITKDSSEKEIDEAIIAHLVTELANDESGRIHHDSIENDSTSVESQASGGSSSDVGDVSLKNLLLLLNARLNPNVFKNSLYSHQHPNLCSTEKTYTSEKFNYIIKVKSYSKKNPAKLEFKRQPDIWGNNLLGTLSHVLPPNYATITGCKALMTTIDTTSEPETNIGFWMRRNVTFRNQMMLLMERFNALFTWPMMLSNIEPSPRQSFTTEVIRVPYNNKNKRFAPLHTSSVTIPNIPKQFLQQYNDTDKNDSIDLPVSTEEDKMHNLISYENDLELV